VRRSGGDDLARPIPHRTVKCLHQMRTIQVSDIRVGGTANSRAKPAVVFSLLKDSAGWPRWSMFISSALERAGDHEPEGVGAIRTFSTQITRTRELVTKLIPDQQLSYALLSGLPFRNYHADVLLTPTDRGTRIDWTATFQCRYGTGWFWRLFMNRVLADMTRRLAVAAEKSNPPA
jgi:polyketide cyclase/dehydrase/lipid transport protein